MSSSQSTEVVALHDSLEALSNPASAEMISWGSSYRPRSARDEHTKPPAHQRAVLGQSEPPR